MSKKVILLLGGISAGLIAFLSNISTIAGYLGIKPDSLIGMIISPFLAAGQWLSESHGIAGWFILIIAILTLLSLTIFFVAIQESRSPNKYTKYTKDNICNTEWHWRWSMMGEVVEIKGYCPTCSAEVSVEDKTAVRNKFSYEIFCYRCEKVIFSAPGDCIYVIPRIRKEIERIARQKYGKH